MASMTSKMAVSSLRCRVLLLAMLLPAQLVLCERVSGFKELDDAAAAELHPEAKPHVEPKAAARIEPAQAKHADTAAAHLDAAPQAALVQQHAGVAGPEEGKSGGLMGGLSGAIGAVSDPRSTIMAHPMAATVIAAFKLAVEASPQKGMCLTSGEFEGYGCQDDGKAPPLCKCSNMLHTCFVPTTGAVEIGKKVLAGQMDQVKAEVLQFLFGQCKTNWVLVGALAGGAVVLLIIVGCVLKAVLGKKNSDES